ncbi:MAG: hypothetical protein DRN15_10230 [Thermoprotei archaeon]|nr:MAG: hypothetical protein DRN15_10230 [Thermoprotei archaeon]RLF24159.1 MAG: hypothetical protein DRM97_03840 [Thermoprotei archaeon]
MSKEADVEKKEKEVSESSIRLARMEAIQLPLEVFRPFILGFSSLKIILTLMNSNISQLSEKVESLNRSIKELKEVVEVLNSTISSETTSLRRDVKDLRKEVEGTVVKRLEGLARLTESLSEELATTRNALDSLRIIVGELDNRFKNESTNFLNVLSESKLLIAEHSTRMSEDLGYMFHRFEELKLLLVELSLRLSRLETAVETLLKGSTKPSATKETESK